MTSLTLSPIAITLPAAERSVRSCPESHVRLCRKLCGHNRAHPYYYNVYCVISYLHRPLKLDLYIFCPHRNKSQALNRFTNLLSHCIIIAQTVDFVNISFDFFFYMSKINIFLYTNYRIPYEISIQNSVTLLTNSRQCGIIAYHTTKRKAGHMI